MVTINCYSHKPLYRLRVRGVINSLVEYTIQVLRVHCKLSSVWLYSSTIHIWQSINRNMQAIIYNGVICGVCDGLCKWRCFYHPKGSSSLHTTSHKLTCSRRWPDFKQNGLNLLQWSKLCLYHWSFIYSNSVFFGNGSKTQSVRSGHHI